MTIFFWIVIPAWDLFSINALTASDSVLIPVEAHILSSDGLEQVEKMIRIVQRKLNPRLHIEGIIITKFQGHTSCCRQVYEIVKRDFGSHIHIFEEPVKYAIKVAEAPAFASRCTNTPRTSSRHRHMPALH